MQRSIGSRIFPLFADETKDCSKHEQMSIVLRYVDHTPMICEHFVTYVEAASLTAEKLTEYIMNVLEKFKLDPQCMVSQGHDGASIMSGHCTGVQKRISSSCYLHSLLCAYSEPSVSGLSQSSTLCHRVFCFSGITVCVYINHKGTCYFYAEAK